MAVRSGLRLRAIAKSICSFSCFVFLNLWGSCPAFLSFSLPLQVGLEVCDCALGIPFDRLGPHGDSQDDDPINRISRVTARVGHLYADTTWTQPFPATGGCEGIPGELSVETLVSSAGVQIEPEGFDILQTVHVRAVATVPLGTAGGASVRVLDGSGRGRSGGEGSARDELAEKLREKTGRDHPEAVDLLPARPVVSRGVGDVGVPADCPQLGVAVSPIRFNLTEPHVVGLACFALDASARLAAILDVLAPPPDPQALGGGSGVEDGAAIACEAEEVGSSTEEELLGAGPGSRSDASVVAPAGVVGADGGGAAAGAGGQKAAGIGAAEDEGSLSPVPPMGDSDSQRNLDAPAAPAPSRQLSNGPSATTSEQLEEGAARGGGSDGGGDRQQLAGGEGESLGETTASTTTPEAAPKPPPVPPAFLGTLIIDAISVMLLEDSGYSPGGGAGTAGDRPGGSVAAGTNGALLHRQPSPTHGAATTAVSATRALRPALSPRRRNAVEGRQRDEGASGSGALVSPPQRCYSGLVCLEVEGVGVGVDLPPSGVAAAEFPLRVSPAEGRAAGVAEDAGDSGGVDRQQQQYRAEFAVKRVSVTDVSGRRRRQGPLVRLVSDGPAAAGGAAKGEGGRRGGDGDDARVLPEGWWRGRNGGGGGGGKSEGAHDGDGEQVLIRVRLCPVSGTATADARLASLRLMLLPAPLLDVLGVVSGVSEGIASFSRSADDAEGHNTSSAERSSTGATTTGVPPAARVAVAASATSGEGGAGLSPSAASTSPPSPTRGRCDEVINLEEERRRNSWRWQTLRALNGAGLAELLWLQRIEVSASAGNLQLWLPGAERDIGAAAAAAGENGQGGGVEAVVASCRRCHAGVSFALGLLSREEAPSAQEAPRPDGALAPSPRQPGSSDPEAVEGREEKTDDTAAAADDSPPVAAESAGADSHDELCAMSLGLHGVEVFVARPSASDFGPRGEEKPPLPPVLSPDAEAGDTAGQAATAVAAPEPDRRLRAGFAGFAGFSNTEGLILPFSADLKHVVLARSTAWSSSPATTPSPSPSPSSLLSEVDASVTAIEAVVFLNFPLAVSIMENSFEPLLQGVGGDSAEAPAAASRVPEETGPAGTPSAVHGLPPPSPPDGIMPGADGPPVAVPGADDGGGGSSEAARAVSELAKMWTCRGGFQAAGLKAEVVNNFYRQKRPSVIVNVRREGEHGLLLGLPCCCSRTNLTLSHSIFYSK